MDNFGTQLKTLRIAAGMTQQDLADKIGTTNVSVCRWERWTRNPNVRIVRDLADALGVTVAQLMGEEPITPKKSDMVSVSALIEMCKKAADTNLNMCRKVLETGRTTDMDMAALAWFEQQEQMYRYMIPGIIRTLVDEMEADNGLS